MVKSFQKYKETDDYRRLKAIVFKLAPDRYNAEQVSVFSGTVPNYYYYNTAKELGIIPPAEHSTVASTLGSGVHKLMGMIGLYDVTTPYAVSLKEYLENGCIPIQIEAAVAGCMFLKQQGFLVMDKETLVQDTRTGTDLYVDLIIKDKNTGQLYTLEIKTVWAAKNEKVNTRDDTTRTHREQAVLAANRLHPTRYGAATLHLVVPYEKVVSYVAASFMLFEPQKVQMASSAVENETPVELITTASPSP